MSKKISDYRPISLITSLYKIIVKVLAGRLRWVLHETIHSTQGAFVQGRQILDAVLIANEIVDEKRRSGEEGVVFKIDFEKAYDHVSWGFLDHVLEKKGFSPRWRKWMRGCLSSVSFVVLVNGNAKGCIEQDVIESRGKKCLRGFQEWVGRDARLQGFWVAYTLPGSYSGRESQGLWLLDLVIERISRRLDGWQKAYLSFGGRITLIQSCFTHMPCYFFSLFKIPVLVAAKIERLQRDFLWSGVGEGKRDHLGNGCGDILGGFSSVASGYFKHLWITLQWLGCQHYSQMVTLLSLEGYRTSLPRVFQVYSVCGRRWGKNSVLEDLWWGTNLGGLFTVKSFFLALSQFFGFPPIFPTKFVWNSQVPFKVKSFVWLVVHKKVNTNDLLQLRRPYKALSPDIFSKDGLGPPRSIFDMLSTNFNGFGSSKRGIVLWQVVCIALIWVVWRERNVRIF
ncbi:Transposon TX1 uncharacterized 149 kDa protein [Vitis vinifera]|uniref:Transposon TX1 uncharacterized 149 kDa protein n=1 Tax=Vitis vinifera TaxID=29760 RepID=A0A438G2W2_VITVI|nr:Transposon TX1 uncharacterized 149 kDa protein [Vitis vinifera]